MVMEPPVTTGSTTRERFDQHRTDPACAGCHKLMDPVGFTMEKFDAVGRWRDRDGGRPVDSTGELVGTEDADGRVDGVGALSRRLAGSKQVGACLVDAWFRYAHGRGATAEDACSLARLSEAVGSTGDLRALLLALTQTDAFLFAGQE